MALILPIHGQMSGSIGGNTFARNKGGQYVRQRVIPTDPATPAQQTRRSVFAALTVAWSSSLTQDQRDAWDLYGANVATTNRLGQAIFLSGMNWFISANTMQNSIGGSFIEDGPTVFTLAELSATSIAVDVSAQTAEVTFSALDGWANEDGGFLIIQQGQPVNVSVNFFRGPFRIMGGVLGADLVPPTSPTGFGTLLFAIAESQRAFFRLRAVRADGRISTPVIVDAELTP